MTVKDSIAIMAGNAAGAGAALVVRAAGGCLAEDTGTGCRHLA